MKTAKGKKPKKINCDRGGEYLNKNMETILNNEGIQLQLTPGYTPQLNGIAERKNRTLIEMAKCLLLDAKLPKKFWGEAINTANYIQNRLPTTCRLQGQQKAFHMNCGMKKRYILKTLTFLDAIVM